MDFGPDELGPIVVGIPSRFARSDGLTVVAAELCGAVIRLGKPSQGVALYHFVEKRLQGDRSRGLCHTWHCQRSLQQAAPRDLLSCHGFVSVDQFFHGQAAGSRRDSVGSPSPCSDQGELLAGSDGQDQHTTALAMQDRRVGAALVRMDCFDTVYLVQCGLNGRVYLSRIIYTAEGAKPMRVARPVVLSTEQRELLKSHARARRVAPRPGRTPTITPAQIQEVIRKTTQEKPGNATHWSTRSMA